MRVSMVVSRSDARGVVVIANVFRLAIAAALGRVLDRVRNLRANGRHGGRRGGACAGQTESEEKTTAAGIRGGSLKRGGAFATRSVWHAHLLKKNLHEGSKP